MEKQTFIARSEFGDKTRKSARVYTHCVVRADGWCMFSQSLAAAERELRYQQGRGRNVVLVEVMVGAS